MPLDATIIRRAMKLLLVKWVLGGSAYAVRYIYGASAAKNASTRYAAVFFFFNMFE
jgi:hypothetical protein